MTMPKAYEPQQGYKYQILFMSNYSNEWESIDYAKDKSDLKHLMSEYRLIGQGVYKSIQLPKKYWNN